MANSNGAGVQQLGDGSQNGCQIQKKFFLDAPTGRHEGYIDNATALLSPIDVSGLNTVVLYASSASSDYFAFTGMEEGQLIWVLNSGSSDGAIFQGIGTIPSLEMVAFRYISIDGVLTWYTTVT